MKNKFLELIQETGEIQELGTIVLPLTFLNAVFHVYYVVDFIKNYRLLHSKNDSDLSSINTNDCY